MISYINHLKYKEMSDNPNSYFNNVQVANFDIIHHECRGDKLKGTYKDNKTIKNEHLANNPKEEAKTVLPAAFGNKRDDLQVKRDLMINDVKENFNQLFFVVNYINDLINVNTF